MRMYFTMSKPAMATKTKPVPPNKHSVPRSVPNRFGLHNIPTVKGTSCGCGK